MDETHATRDRVLVVNQEMAFSRATGKPLGTVVTMRDQTEFLHLSGELAATRTLTDALRSQTHEFANRLHTVVALIELGRVDDAILYASDEIDRHTRARSDGDAPGAGATAEVIEVVLAAKQAQARERGVTLTVDTTRLRGTLPSDPGDVVTVIGNLVDNAVDAVTEARSEDSDRDRDRDRSVSVTAETVGRGARFVVRDDGAGIPDIDAAYGRGWSSKSSGPEGRGIGLDLVRSTVARIGGGVTVTTGPDGTTFVVDLTPGEAPA
ncbi:sensor histidine kinase [Curtobacterium sp. 314Chir4.1]|uniref:sensor histidine kinase n=1 Tax=Curtobacterium sp. 314Chir4.1 TaxID=1279028 RepID=UPI0020D1F91E|nr:ATP-binding protein [Curtobacterium sp. 314Chir4.1]